MIAFTGGMYKIRMLCTRRPGRILRWLQEGTEMKRTSGAAPQILYSYYDTLACRSIECKDVTYRQ